MTAAPGPPEPDVFPASPAQERVWFVGRLEPDLPVYTVGMTVPLPAGCDAATVRAALARVVARHESLRTALRLDDGPPPVLQQLVHPSVPVEVPVGDTVEAAAAELLAAPIDPGAAPPWRARFVPAPDGPVLVFACHHAVFDGGSSDLFVAELLECCTAARDGREPRLPELGIQYADYTVWLRERLTDPAGAAERAAGRAHWSRVTEGLPADAGLPADRPAPVRRDRRGAVHRADLGAGRTAAVHAWSRRAGRTPFMTTLAAYAVLLGRLSGRTDVAVSCPVAQRPVPELQPLIGMFVTSVVVRVDLAGDPSFRDVTTRVRGAVLDAVEHAGAAGHLPPQQVAFNLVPADTRGQLPTGTTLTDLALDLSLRDGTFHATVEYATDRFEAATVRRLTAAWLTLLDAALADPDAPIAQLPLPFDRPAGAGALRWIDGPPLPAAPLVPARVAAHTAARPDAAAVVDGDRELTYAELDRAAAGLAARLTALVGDPGGRPVAVALRRGAAAVVAWLGALHAGVPFVALDPDAPAARRQRVLDDADPCAVVADPTDVDVAAGRPLLVVEHPVALGAVAPAVPGPVPSRAAYLAYTSGSTGEPRGVVVGAVALARFVAGAVARYGLGPDDRVLQFAPLTFDTAVEEVFGALGAGATLVVRTGEAAGAPARLLAECARLRITVLDLPTAYWHELVVALAAGLRLPGALRTVVIGGEAALPARVAQWHTAVPASVRLINTYGPTEATVVATAADLAPGADPDGGVPIGRPLPGVRAAVVDGELFLAGGALADGYHQRPAETARRFVELDGERAYRTGDRVRVRADGQLVFTGRTDDEVKISGHRVDPAAVESVLAAHPWVGDAAVVVERAATGTPRLVAHVVPAAPAPVPAPDLRAHVAAVLPGPLVPAEVIVTDHIPRTPNGKTDRSALARAAEPEPAAPAGFADPGNGGVLAVLLDVWEEVLGVRPGPGDDFFALGGQSLQTIQVATRLSAELGRDVDVGTVFAHPTAAALTAALAIAPGGIAPAGIALGATASGSNSPGTNASGGTAPCAPANGTAPGATAPSGTGPSGTSPATTALAGALAEEVAPVAPAPVLPADIRPASTPAPARTEGRGRTVLLTGTTGFVGRHLLAALLADPGTRVVAAVRATDDAAARARLAALPPVGSAPSSGPSGSGSAPVSGPREQLDAVAVDLARPHLGLDPDRFAELARGLDVVVHAGAEVSLARGYESLSAVNVGGTVEVLRLAAGGSAAVHLVSSVAAAEGAGGYRHSKWAAEELAGQAAARGLPVVVHRLGRVTGSVNGGDVNARDLVWRVLAAGVAVGALPEIDVVEPWTPADWVAGAVVAATRVRTGGPYVLLPTAPVAWAEVFGWVRAAGFDLGSLPVERWLERVRELPGHAAVAVALAAPPGSPPSGPPQANAVPHLPPGVPDCPRIGEAAMRSWLRTAVREGILPPFG